MTPHILRDKSMSKDLGDARGGRSKGTILNSRCPQLISSPSSLDPRPIQTESRHHMVPKMPKCSMHYLVTTISGLKAKFAEDGDNFDFIIRVLLVTGSHITVRMKESDLISLEILSYNIREHFL